MPPAWVSPSAKASGNPPRQLPYRRNSGRKCFHPLPEVARWHFRKQVIHLAREAYLGEVQVGESRLACGVFSCSPDLTRHGRPLAAR